MAKETKAPSSSVRRRSGGQTERRNDDRRKARRYPAAGLPTDDPPPDVETLRKVRAEYYSTPEQRRATTRPNMTYVSESVTRVPVHRVKVRHSSKVDPKPRHRIRSNGSEPRNHRRKVQVTEDSHQDSEYVYRVVSDERRTENEDVSNAAEDSTHDRSSDATNREERSRNARGQRPKSRRKSTREDDRRSKQKVDQRRATTRRQSEPLWRMKTQRQDSESGTEVDQSPRIYRRNSMTDKSSTTTRPPLQRSKTTILSKAESILLPPVPIRTSRSRTEKSSSIFKDVKKNAGLFSTLFGPPPDKIPEKKVTCLTCLSDDIPISKSAKLACSHRMCHECLTRIFTMSVKDPQHMPPRCCTSDHIPLKHVDKLFDRKFKERWNRKYQEYTTKNRIYCPTKGCGEWIKPGNIFMEKGRKYGICSQCKIKVCCICNGKWHSGRDCPKDEETKKFVEVAKKEGWQRCFNCSAMVELKEGCNHMTCRCAAEFCMICGCKWKTCDCPWFNYEAVENDRLNHMNIPRARWMFANGGGAAPVRFQEEMDRRREQEQRDEALARRLQVLGLDDDDDDDDLTGRNGGVFGIGNAADHFMNQDFMRRAANVLAGNFRNAEQAATELLAENPLPPLPPPLQRRRTANGIPNPPPPAQPQPQPPPPRLLRTPTTASRTYNTSPHTRPSERVVPRRNVTDYATEAARHRPSPLRRSSTPTARNSQQQGRTGQPSTARPAADEPNPAGQVGRIEEWRDGVIVGEVEEVSEVSGAAEGNRPREIAPGGLRGRRDAVPAH